MFSNLKDLQVVYTNSTNGRSVDGVITKLLYNVTNKGGASSRPSINKMKGEENMDKDQLINALKKDFQIDVIDLTATNAAMVAEIAGLKVKNASLEQNVLDLNKEISDVKEAQLNKEFDVLLNSLIDEGKSTQNLNASIYKDAFKAMGLDKAKEIAKTMPVIANLKSTSVSAKDEDDQEDTSKDVTAIKAIQEKKGISFNEAAREFYEAKRKEKK